MKKTLSPKKLSQGSHLNCSRLQTCQVDEKPDQALVNVLRGPVVFKELLYNYVTEPNCLSVCEDVPLKGTPPKHVPAAGLFFNLAHLPTGLFVAESRDPDIYFGAQNKLKN